jgi:ATP-dependent Lon protease
VVPFNRGRIANAIYQAAVAVGGRNRELAEGLADQVVDALEDKTVHLHVPAGAIPKDGPSAGVTLVTAMVSVLTGRSVREEIGMTGEVTLQGRVLPVGGIKQKVLAAHRRGLKTVVLPKANEVDLEDVPEEIRDELAFELVEHVDEVLQLAFESELDIESSMMGGNGRQKEAVEALA